MGFSGSLIIIFSVFVISYEFVIYKIYGETMFCFLFLKIVKFSKLFCVNRCCLV